MRHETQLLPWTRRLRQVSTLSDQGTRQTVIVAMVVQIWAAQSSHVHGACTCLASSGTQLTQCSVPAVHLWGQPKSELGGSGLGRCSTQVLPEELHMPPCSTISRARCFLPAGLLQKGLNEPGGLLGAPSELSLANVTKSGRVSTFGSFFPRNKAIAESGGQLLGPASLQCITCPKNLLLVSERPATQP